MICHTLRTNYINLLDKDIANVTLPWFYFKARAPKESTAYSIAKKSKQQVDFVDFVYKAFRYIVDGNRQDFC